ncbi:MAG: N-formylglutamate amidohydrolase [Pseudomonadota bacterium]
MPTECTKNSQLALDLVGRKQTLGVMRIAFDYTPAAQARALDAFTIRRPEALVAPVVFASPHSGQVYPSAMTERLSVPLRDLQRTEDAFVDELYVSAVDQGAILMDATYARGFVDLNRDARELDATMFYDGLPRAAGMPSARVKAGLGCLPRVGASGRNIYAGQISRQEGHFRLTTVHDRYHAALQAEVDALKRNWSDVYIIDCHSMPSRQPGRAGMPDIVLGDRFGSSCSARLTSLAERRFRLEGLSVTRNAPYAGGYTTRRYGRPRRGVHVLQIEINRALYMNEIEVQKTSGFAIMQSQISRFIADIVEFAQARSG